MMRLVLLRTEMRCVWQRLGKSEHCIWDELTNAPRLLMLQRLLYVKNYLAKFTKYDIQCNFQIYISYDLKISALHYNIQKKLYSNGILSYGFGLCNMSFGVCIWISYIPFMDSIAWNQIFMTISALVGKISHA